jgi:WD40 repeat protein
MAYAQDRVILPVYSCCALCFATPVLFITPHACALCVCAYCSIFYAYIYTGHEMLSGCAAGDVRFWDIRMSGSLSAMSVQRSPMTALAAHSRVPVLASGSHNQFIKALTLDGETLAVIRYHDGFLGQRIGPVSALAFHPHRLVLAAGATDSIVSVYSAGD